MDSIPQKYMGIDTHKYFSEVDVDRPDGERIERRRLEHSDIEGIRAFLRGLGDGVAAAIEPTCGWMWLVDEMQKAGIEVHLAHPPAVSLIARNHVKTDKIDARALATLLRLNALPEAYIAPPAVRDERMLLRFREGVKKTCTMTKSRIHALLLRYNLTGPGVSDLFGKTGRQYLMEVSLPAQARFIVDYQLTILMVLETIMQEIEKRIHAAIKDDRRADLLQTIPGIGKLTAHLLLAEIGDIHRFRSAAAFVSYCGLCPSVRQSANHARYGHIYGGRRCLRWALVESAQTAARHDPRLGRFYQAKRAQKGAGKATVAVAHRLAKIVYHMLKEMRPYYAGAKQNKQKRTFKKRVSRTTSSAGPRSL